MTRTVKVNNIVQHFITVCLDEPLWMKCNSIVNSGAYKDKDVKDISDLLVYALNFLLYGVE